MSVLSRHPKALPFLFLTEMWERFGFYVVQGMLVLYLSQAFGFSDDKSYSITGVFSALAYVSPMVGGFIADRILGFKLSIAWGGIFLSAGYALLALPGHNEFYLALATIIVGNGLFKPNISSLLGALYPPGDTARDAGFTIFYVGINLGVLLASLTSGPIKDYFGWHAGFALASIGILVGLSIFATGLKWGDIHYEQNLSLRNRYTFLNSYWLFFYCISAIGALTIFLQVSTLSQWLLPIVGLFLLFYIFFLAFRQNVYYRNRMILLNTLILSAIIFWMFFLQLFFSANFFINRLVNKQAFGIHLSTTLFYGLESIFVILLGPFFAWGWQALDQRNGESSPFLKFIWAILMVGLGFTVLAYSTYFTNDIGLVNPLWVVLAYLFITIGELLLSPIGLSAVTQLSPKHLTGMMMGIWFASLGFGGLFGGILAKLASVPASATTTTAQLEIYRGAFFDFAGIAFGIGLVLFLLQIVLKNTVYNATKLD